MIPRWLPLLLVVAVGATPTALPAAAAPPAHSPASSSTRAPGGPAVATTGEQTTDRALRRARGALAGDADPGSALRALFRALPRLARSDPAGAREARALLARPTARRRDRRGDGYRAPSVRRCRRDVCVHWVRSTRDAPPSGAWARATARLVQATYDAQVGDLGYRAPRPDGRRGGDRRLDVYLADVGARGLYGYCAPERLPAAARTRRTRGSAASYCVLDDDFARRQFGRRPRASLRVTAAHELFHAVQLAYDRSEASWLQESTATWMEERLADEVNDNRRYLPFGQLRRPGRPLDAGSPGGFAQYGNWVFWQYLSRRHGDRAVREVWRRAAARPGGRDAGALAALRRTMRARGPGLPAALGRYAAANRAREVAYPEGVHWPRPRVRAVHRVSPDRRRRAVVVRVRRLASQTVLVRPGAAGRGARLRPGRWRLRVRVAGPARSTGATASLVVTRGERQGIHRVDLDRRGDGLVEVAVSRRTPRVAVVLSNAGGETRRFGVATRLRRR